METGLEVAKLMRENDADSSDRSSVERGHIIELCTDNEEMEGYWTERGGNFFFFKIYFTYLRD